MVINKDISSEPVGAVRPVSPVTVDADTALAQAGRILDSPVLVSSKRCSTLLRYIVDKTIKGEQENLTERTIGIEVFGRNPDYDTNLDPTVRVAATELRKRLTRYYIEPGHEEEPRIEIPVRSYVAKFSLPEQRSVSPDPVPLAPAPSRVRYWYFAVPVAAIVLALLGWQLVRVLIPTSASDKFWSPVIENPSQVLLTVSSAPRTDSASPPGSEAQGAGHVMTFEQLIRQHVNNVSMTDVAAATNVLFYLQGKGKDCQIRPENALIPGDFRSHSVVIFGVFNNDWSTRLGSDLRFRFRRDSEHGKRWIEDSTRPLDTTWMLDMSAPSEQVESDYALISRVFDGSTGQWWIGIAGLTGLGTIAAQRALIDPKMMTALASGFPAHWERKNMQIVLAVKLVQGGPGIPRVVATTFW